MAEGKSHKAGRNGNSAKAYAASNRREKNKARKLRRHVLAHPADGVGLNAYLGIYHYDNVEQRKAVKASPNDVLRLLAESAARKTKWSHKAAQMRQGMWARKAA